MGADANALLLGLVAAVVSAVYSEGIDKPGKSFAAVLIAAFLAGWVSPVLVGWAAGYLPGNGGGNGLHLGLAVIIGLLVPPCLPMAIKRAQRLIGGEGGVA